MTKNRVKIIAFWGSIASIIGVTPLLYAYALLMLEKINGYREILPTIALLTSVVSIISISGCFYFYKKSRAKASGLNSVKDVNNVCCDNNHNHTKQLKYSMFELYNLETKSISLIDEEITTPFSIDAGVKKVRNFVFDNVEKITCDYGQEMATSLKDSLDATISMLGFPDQKTRVLIKTIDDETSINHDGTKDLSLDGGTIKNAVWDECSWKEVKTAINKYGLPFHKLDDSTALSHIVRGKCDFYINNNTRQDRYYEAAPDIYEKDYSAKLAVPIKYFDDSTNEILLFGFVVVLLENSLGEEIFIDKNDSLLVSMVFSVVNLLVILMSGIHNTNRNIESFIEEKCGSILKNRRFEDSSGKG